jgi:hypothetical protein
MEMKRCLSECVSETRSNARSCPHADRPVSGNRTQFACVGGRLTTQPNIVCQKLARPPPTPPPRPGADSKIASFVITHHIYDSDVDPRVTISKYYGTQKKMNKHSMNRSSHCSDLQHTMGEDAGEHNQACSVQPGVLQLSPQQPKVQGHDRDMQQSREVHCQLPLLIEPFGHMLSCIFACHGFEPGLRAPINYQ